MSCLSKTASSLVIATLLGNTVLAQGPVNPPPWWKTEDEVTVSLHWSFDTTFPPGQPTAVPDLEVVPQWYNNPSPWTADPAIEYIPTLSGHTGCLGLVGNGAQQTAALELFVDNDPHLDWVKIFWFQFDMFEGGGDVGHEIEKQLTKYGRASVKEDIVDLGSGWSRVTVHAELIPQPDDEKIDWSFIELGSGAVAIDNLFVSSKCIKPRPDEKGRALGTRTTPPINTTVLTGGRPATAAAKTLGTAMMPGQRYWLAVRSPTSQHEVVQLNDIGQPIGTPVIVPSTPLASPLGLTDLAVERIYDLSAVGGGALVEEFVFAIEDRRPSGPVVVHRIDPNLPTPVLSTIPLLGFPVPPGPRFGLAFDPTGEEGAGSFWVTAPSTNVPGSWAAYEFSRSSGVLIDIREGLPASTGGLAYDEKLGYFYGFSSDPVARPGGPDSLVNGFEISGFDHQLTGVRFCGDLTLPNPGGNPGGTAAGIDLYRTDNGLGQSEVRFVCVTNAGSEQYLYELAGPYRYGYSRFGRCGMRNGPPFLGGSFDVTLEGVPSSLLSVLFLGSTDANLPISAGIQPEQVISIVPDANSGVVAPSLTPGQFQLPIGLPNTATLSYAELFFQWIVLDPTAEGGVGFSNAGKTVIYP